MTRKISVAILDDHQSIVDGYLFRLRNYPNIEVVATAVYGDELEPMVINHKVDVLILDVSVPMSADNRNPYPLLHLIPKLLDRLPGLAILPISMHAERSLIQAVVKAGASGYILKDDHANIRQLGRIISVVAQGGVYFSKLAHQLLLKDTDSPPLLTPRQLEVLNLFVSYPHLTSNAAAQKLNVADSTVRNLLSEIYQRLNVPNRSGAILRARQLGLVVTEEPTVSVSNFLVEEEE